MSEAAAPAGFSRLLSDDRLTRRAVGGDERAFAAIFRRYHQGLYRFCLAIVGNSEDAQDALQNTMIKVLRALPGEEREIELKPWLYRIARNESIDLLRRRRETRQLDAEQIAPGHGLAEDVATRERLRRLLADLRELPERQREVLVMRELAGLDFEEIGVSLGTSSAVARQTLYEARLGLRQMEEGREMSCDAVTKALSDGDGRVTRRRDVRAHLRACPDCRRFRDEIKGRQRDLAALSPLPAVAAAGMLQGLVGGSGAATGGSLATALGGGAAKTIATSAAAKGVATVAVVAAMGVTAADRSGVIHLGLPGDGGARSGEPVPEASGAQPGSGAGDSSDSAKGAAAADGARSSAPGEASRHPSPANPTVGANQGRAHGKGQGKDASAQAGAKPHGPPADHATGRGHETQLPDAAAGGQETAAGQKSPSSGSSGSGSGDGNGSGVKSKEAKEPKPPKEAKEPKPPKEAKEPKPSGPPSSGSPGSAPKGPPANPPEGAPPPQAHQPHPPANGSEKSPPGSPADPGGQSKGSEKKPQAP
jgi:RNA polymerase sigma factor (sigma-70 family)